MAHLADHDTIAAISTPPGRGGIGIVRLAGPRAIEIAQRLLTLDAPPEHARATFTRVLDPSNPASTLDDALLTVFRAPHSYTGEDIAEIAAHGAPVVLEAILHAALAHGARLAQPGEFTQRAFLAGRLDLTQAEAVHDLIAAQTLEQARVAAQQLGGALARQVAPAKGSLLHLIALLEAGMDFAAGELDDVDLVAPAQVAAALAETRTPLAALAATFPRGRVLRQGVALALIGPPNAGKSSLFNRLLARDRAIVTPLPGTTRDTLEETLALDGIPLRLIDTAGLRDLPHANTELSSNTDLSSRPKPASSAGAVEKPVLSLPKEPAFVPGDSSETIDQAEQLGIARTREALADADLVLLIHDATQPYSAEELQLARELAQPGLARPHLHIHNKIDLLPPGAFPPAPEPHATAPAPTPIRTSALTGEGLDRLRAAILEALGAPGGLAETALLNNLRQHEAVAASLAALDAAERANRGRLPHELLLLDLHAALDALDALTGVTTADDILAHIFATFCIGK